MRSPYAVPFVDQSIASEPNARTLSHNTTCHEQLSTLFQRWHPPSPPTFAMRHDDHFSISRTFCRWNRLCWLCLPGQVLGHQPNSSGLRENGHSIFSSDLLDTQSSPYGDHLAMNSGWLNTFNVENRITFRCL